MIRRGAFTSKAVKGKRPSHNYVSRPAIPEFSEISPRIFQRGAVFTDPHQRDPLNLMERRFAENYLDVERREARVMWWAFESITLRLAKGSRYTCDFFGVARVGEGIVLRAYETKGHQESAAAVRLKVAARLFPWIEFFKVKEPSRGAYTFERIWGWPSPQ